MRCFSEKLKGGGFQGIQSRPRPSAFRPWSPQVSVGERESSAHPLALLRDRWVQLTYLHTSEYTENFLNCRATRWAPRMLCSCSAGLVSCLSSFTLTQVHIKLDSHPVFCFPLSFYNYKCLEKGVAPNVTLTSLPLEKVGLLSPSLPSTSHSAPNVAAKSRPCKKRATAAFPAQEAPCPSFSATSKLPPEESEVEIEVESREEGKFMFVLPKMYRQVWAQFDTVLTIVFFWQSPPPCPPCHHHRSPHPAAQPKTWAHPVTKDLSAVSYQLRAWSLQPFPFQA